MVNVRQDVSRFKKAINYISNMFPYTDDENTWVSSTHKF